MLGCKGDEGLREVVQGPQNICIAVQQKDHHLKPPIVSTLIQNLTKIHFFCEWNFLERLAISNSLWELTRSVNATTVEIAINFSLAALNNMFRLAKQLDGSLIFKIYCQL